MSIDSRQFGVVVHTGSVQNAQEPRGEWLATEELLREWFPDASYHDLTAMRIRMHYAVGQEIDCVCGGWL